MNKLIRTIALVFLLSAVAKANFDTDNLPKKFSISCIDKKSPYLMELEFVRYAVKTTDGDYIQNESVGLFHHGIGLNNKEWRSDHIVMTHYAKEFNPTINSSKTSIYFQVFNSFKNEDERKIYNVVADFDRLINGIQDGEKFNLQISIHQKTLAYTAELGCLRYR